MMAFVILMSSLPGQSTPASNAGDGRIPPRALLDFAEVRKAQIAILSAAAQEPSSAARDKVVLDAIELIAPLADKGDGEKVDLALAPAGSTPDNEALLARWRKLREISVSVQNSSGVLPPDPSNTMRGEVNEIALAALAPDRDALVILRRQVDTLPTTRRRDALSMGVAAELAIVDRLANDNAAVAADIAESIRAPQWSSTTAPLVLQLVQLRAAAAVDESRGTDTARRALDEMLDTAKRARTYWSFHPALTLFDEEAANLAVQAGQKSVGRSLLSSLVTEDRGGEGAYLEQSRLAGLAFDLDDIPLATRILLGSLASSTPPGARAADDWLQTVQLFYGLHVDDKLAARASVLSALLGDPTMAPPNSPVHDWLLLQLGELYLDAGQEIGGRALRQLGTKQTPPEEGTVAADAPQTAAALEAKALAFGPNRGDSDPAGRAAVLRQAVRQRLDGEGFNDEGAFIALKILIGDINSLKSAGGAGEVDDIIGRLAQNLPELLKPPPPPKGAQLDNFMINVEVGITSVVEELLADGYEASAERLQLAGFDFEATQIRANLASHYADGSLGISVTTAGILGQRMLNAQLQVLAVNAFMRAIVRPIGGGQLGDLPQIEEFSILSALSTLLEGAGDEPIAGRFSAGVKALQFDFTKSVSPSSFCETLTALARGAVQNRTTPIGATLMEEMRAACRDGASDMTAEEPPTISNALPTTWIEEEVRLRALQPPDEGAQGKPGASMDITTFSCRTEGGLSDPVRVSRLAALDSARSIRPPDSRLEAQALLRLAASYDARSDPGIVLDLLHSTLDVSLYGVTPSGEASGIALACLGEHLLALDRQTEARRLAEATDQQVRARLPDGYDAYSSALREASPVLADMALHSPADASNGIDALTSLGAEALPPRLVSVLADVRRRAHVAPPSRTAEDLDRLSALATSRLGIESRATGLVYAVQAEHEILAGSIDHALAFADLLALSEADRSPAGLDDNDLLELADQLRLWAGEIRRQRMEIQPSLAAQLELDPSADSAQLAHDLRDIVAPAMRAGLPDTTLDVFRRWIKLHPDFDQTDPFIQRSSPEDAVSDIVEACSSLQLDPMGVTDPRLFPRDCASVAFAVANLVAVDALEVMHAEQPEQRTKEELPYSFEHVHDSLAPLLGDGRFDGEANLTDLFRWSTAVRPTRLSTTVEDLVIADGSKDGQPRLAVQWHRALSTWLRDQANAECAADADANSAAASSARDAASASAGAVASAWRDMMTGLPDEAVVAAAPVPDVAALQGSLAENEAILDFIVTGNQVIIWLVKSHELTLRSVPRGTLKRDTDTLLGQISDRKSLSEGFALDSSERLYAQLLAPVEGRLEGVDELYIAADYEAGRVPFAALVSSAPASPVWRVSDHWTPPWLVRQFAVTAIPSIGGFAASRTKASRAPRGVLAMGDPLVSAVDPGAPEGACERVLAGNPPSAASGTAAPLPPAGVSALGPTPGAATEIEKASSAAGRLGRPILARAAFSRRNLLEASLSGQGLLVFATHGVRETPWSSARLLVSPESPEDSHWLTAEDVAALPLDADLVILSACNSGLASGRGGFNSLMTAFMAAGARQLVATSWEIGAQTAEAITMPLVRKYVADGSRNFDKALQSGQNDMLAAPYGTAIRHPHYWAGVFLLGASTR
ncbi:CHAT domain-containing protein [Mesorhizobium sp. M0482]|uniref:CHAT domain-containing protein n=1 Tax=Mesorhizobium sp. M0482 TaxID=2956948 RepID=UPI00333B5E7D